MWKTCHIHIKYTACMRVRGSDHKPVVALFELEAKVRPHADAKQVLVAALHKEQEQLGDRLKQLRQQSDACHDALRKHDRVAPSAPTSSNETSSLIDLNFVSSSLANVCLVAYLRTVKFVVRIWIHGRRTATRWTRPLLKARRPLSLLAVSRLCREAS